MSRPSIEPRNKGATSECRRGPNAWKTTSCHSFWQERQELGGVEDLGMLTRIMHGNRESLGVSVMEQSVPAEQSSTDRVGKGVTVRRRWTHSGSRTAA